MSDEDNVGTTVGKIPRWEAELWSYLSKGDGTHCPIYESCRFRLQGGWCVNEREEHYRSVREFIDNDDEASDPAEPVSFDLKFSACPESGRIFELVTRLAIRYQTEAGIDHPPVPTNLITRADDNLPIEVRKVPLKAHHGAIWRLSDCWIVQLNSNDTAARQRCTLYHEIFHILAHCRATPVFRKASGSQEGYFNELLADHFAAIMLMPYKLMKEKWAEVKDINQMAAMFDVPKTLMLFALNVMKLI